MARGMYEYFRSGDAKAHARRIDHRGHRPQPGGTAIVETAKVGDAYLVPDTEAVTVIYDLLQHEGLCLGGSTGINIAGAVAPRQAAWAGQERS